MHNCYKNAKVVYDNENLQYSLNAYDSLKETENRKGWTCQNLNVSFLCFHRMFNKHILTYLCFISILNVFNRFARFNRELYIHSKWRVTRFRLHVIHPYLWLCLSEYVKYEKIQYNIPLDINCFLFTFSVVYFHIRINTAQKVYRSVGAFFLKWNKNRSINFLSKFI